MDLTTSTRVATLVNASGSAPAAFTSTVGQLITAVSAAVESYLDRYAESGVSRTEYLPVTTGQMVFRLRAYPIASVTSVTFDIEQSFATALSSSDYMNPVYSNTGLLNMRYPLRICDGYPDTMPGVLKVVYTGGMASSAANFITAYPDIAGAVDQQVAYLYHQRNNLGTSSVSGDAGSVSAGADSWLPSVLDTLRRYRRLG